VSVGKSQLNSAQIGPPDAESLIKALEETYNDPVELSNGTLTVFYHQNRARKAEGLFNGRAEEGPWTFWDKRGNVVGRGAYVNGVPDGPWSAMYADGSPQYAVTYVEGKLEGYCEFRDKNGQLASKTGLYRKGVLVTK